MLKEMFSICMFFLEFFLKIIVINVINIFICFYFLFIILKNLIKLEENFYERNKNYKI